MNQQIQLTATENTILRETTLKINLLTEQRTNLVKAIISRANVDASGHAIEIEDGVLVLKETE